MSLVTHIMLMYIVGSVHRIRSPSFSDISMSESSTILMKSDTGERHEADVMMAYMAHPY